MKVSDVMTDAALTDSAGDSLAEAAAKMWQQQTGSLLITEGDNLQGIVTERDIMRVVAEGTDPHSVTLKEVMTTDVVTTTPETSLKDAAEIMFQKWFRHLPVVTGEGKIVGIISLRDLLNVVAEGMTEPERITKLTGHKLVRDVRLERVEAGDLD